VHDRQVGPNRAEASMPGGEIWTSTSHGYLFSSPHLLI
jgi:hypothetical protein